MPREYSSDDGYTAEMLVQSALDHLHSADRLFSSDDIRTLDSAGYLAHLGVELLLKALILDGVGRFSSGHSLKRLYEKAQDAQPGFSIPDVFSALLPVLDDHFRLRYPNPSKPANVSKGGWRVICDIVEHIRNASPENLKDVQDSSSADAKGDRRIFRTREDYLSL